jgi:hypothetical protein
MHYPDSEPTSLCLLILLNAACFKWRSSKYQFHSQSLESTFYHTQDKQPLHHRCLVYSNALSGSIHLIVNGLNNKQRKHICIKFSNLMKINFYEIILFLLSSNRHKNLINTVYHRHWIPIYINNMQLTTYLNKWSRMVFKTYLNVLKIYICK